MLKKQLIIRGWQMKHFIVKILDKLKDIYNKKSLYYLYFIGLATIIISIIPENEMSAIVLLLGFLIILVPTIYDSYMVTTKISQSKIVVFIINFILFYIIYGIAEILSKEHIRAVVNFMPDSYTTAIYFFAIFYIPCASIIIFIIISILFLIICFVLSILKDIGGEWVKSKLNGLQNYIVKRLDFKNKIHMTIFLSIGLYCGIILFVVIFIKAPSFYFSKYAPAIIHYTSYYKNDKICSKINEKYYIKILGDNLASISPFIGKINDSVIEQYNGHTRFFFPLLYRKNKEVEQDFIIKQCN